MMIKNKSIFGWLAIAALTLTSSCSDDINMNRPDSSSDPDNVLTIMVSPQAQSIATRAEQTDLHISDGKKVDVLVFAVYESEDGENFSLAEDFQKAGAETKGFVTRGKGQNLIDVPADWTNNPIRIQLVTNPEKYYKVAFWAQNSNFGGFDTKNLEKVQVIYPGASASAGGDTPSGAAETYAWLNNDEASDAFCRTLTIPPHPVGVQEVVLRRPLAQINVATSGWDYEGAQMLNPSPVKYMWSEIKVKNVAQYYDVVEGKAITSDDSGSLLTDAYFTYSYLPAFYYYTVNNQQAGIPSLAATDISKDELLKVKRGMYANIDYAFNKMSDDTYYDYLTWHRFFNFKAAKNDELDSDSYVADDQFYGKYYSIETVDGKETITLVDSSADDFDPSGYYTTSQLFEYLDSESNEADPKMIASEIYKYLSMCYVLVDDAVDSSGKPTSSTVDVEFRYKGRGITTTTSTNDNGESVSTSVADGTEKETDWFKILSVPVQKNYRTNIIGDGFFVYNQTFNIYVIPDYCGEYDHWFDAGDNRGDEDKWLWGTSDSWKDKDKNNWGINSGSGIVYDDFNVFKDDYYKK